MGSDFICSVCPLPIIKDEKKLQEIILGRIDNLTLPKCYELLELFHYDYKDDIDKMIDESITEDHLFKVDNIRGHFAKQIVKNMLRDALDEIIFEENRRDIAHIMLEHKWWIISGGMSWGDSPTEAMNSIDILDSSGILDNLN